METQAPTLADRALAAIEETERIAREATGEIPRLADGCPSWTAHAIRGATVGDRTSWVLADHGPIITDAVRPMVAAHIAHNDPAAVLRRCAADRKIVELHSPVPAGGYVDCRVCRVPYVPEEEAEAWPCDTVRALAEGYGITP